MNKHSAIMKSLTIGGMLLDAGKITSADAERILKIQKEQGLLFGDAAKHLGLVTEEEIQQALSEQFDFPFLPITNDNISTELIAAYQPFSQQVEVLRAVRSELMLRWFNDQRKSLAIVSPSKDEGKSYVAANLAIVFSQLGERTLLIDGDLRKPRQHQLFKITEKYGLSDLLASRADYSIIRKVPGFFDLSILVAGTIPPNPSELISRGLGEMIEQLTPLYEVILFDTPASLQSSDAMLITEHAKGALLLARQHRTRLSDLNKVKNLLESHNVLCAGTMISEF